MKSIALKLSFKLLCFLTLAMLVMPLGAGKASGQTIKIGIIGPMQFLYGDHQWKAAQLAADEINDAGGILVKGKKHTIELVKADDNCFISIPDAVSAMERLTTMSKVDFVIGGFRTEAVLAQQEIMADNKTIYLGTGSAHDEQNLRVGKNYERYKYWFRVGPHASSLQAQYYLAVTVPVLNAIRSELGVEKPKVAILADRAQWCDPIVETARKVFDQMGCEVVGDWRPSFTANSAVSEFSAIKSVGAHLIFQLHAGPAGSPVARQWGDLQIPAAIAGVNVEAVRGTFWDDTRGACNYMGTADAINPGVAITERTIPFVEAFRERFGELPAYTGVGAYDAFGVLKEAIERADYLDTDDVIVALEKTDYTATTGRMAFYPRDHERPHDLRFGPDYTAMLGVQWIDGKRGAYWPDGKELPQAILDMGAPSGWDKVNYEGIQKYVLPPWVVEHWKVK
jgi:branched-chain amino acid transport system substrate-binding protein